VKATQLREMSNEQLDGLIEERMRALRNFRIQLVTSAVENVRAVRETRRDVARIKTILRERELAAHPEIRKTSKKKG
jgi:large subunit ribosomal protein L29